MTDQKNQKPQPPAINKSDFTQETDLTPELISKLAQAMGRKGGSVRSAAKTRASRENGKRNAERIRALKAQQTAQDSTQQPPGAFPATS